MILYLIDLISDFISDRYHRTHQLTLTLSYTLQAARSSKYMAPVQWNIINDIFLGSFTETEEKDGQAIPIEPDREVPATMMLR